MDDTKEIVLKISGLNKYIVALIVILLIGGLGYGVYVLNDKYQGEPEPTVSPTTTSATPTNSFSETPDPTTTTIGRQEYENTIYHFGLSYPNEWSLREKPGNSTITQHLFTLDLRTNDEQSVVTIAIHGNKDNLSLDEWLKETGLNSNSHADSNVNGIPAYKYTKTAMGLNASQYIFLYQQQIFVFTSLPNDEEFERILDSWSFLE